MSEDIDDDDYYSIDDVYDETPPKEYPVLKHALWRLLERNNARGTWNMQPGRWNGTITFLDLDLRDDPAYRQEVERAHSTTELRKLLNRYSRELHASGIIVSVHPKFVDIRNK
jgi:hypothetical protein